VEFQNQYEGGVERLIQALQNARTSYESSAGLVK
jgi:hypothetical protein